MGFLHSHPSLPCVPPAPPPILLRAAGLDHLLPPPPTVSLSISTGWGASEVPLPSWDLGSSLAVPFPWSHQAKDVCSP